MFGKASQIQSGDSILKEIKLTLLLFTIILTGAIYADSSEFISISDTITDDESLIRDAYDVVEVCFESEDLDGLMAYFSGNYLDNGKDHSDERTEIEEIFNDYDNLEIEFILGAITIDGNTATVEEDGSFSGDPVGGVTRETDSWSDISYWIKEDGQWRFYGNQRRFKLAAKSKHHTTGYYLRFALFDTDKYNITSATVEGPDLTGPVNLNLEIDPIYDFNWWTIYSPVTGTPVVPATYTFTINTDSGTFIETDVIEQNITEFAVLKYPEDGSMINTISPIFTWEGISLPGISYGIELHKEDGTRIWERRGITVNAVTYNSDGTASEQLQSGRTYHWIIVAEDKQGNFGGNQSLPDSFAFSVVLHDSYPLLLNGEYWFGSLSAGANSWLPWGKAGSVIINGNNWYQEWDDYDGHHSYSGTFTTSVQPDGSININHAWGSYNVAWNGKIMVQADTAPDSENHLGFEIIARKATNIDVNDVVGQYACFMNWLGWNDRYAGVQWGDFEILADGTWVYDGIDHNSTPHHHSGTWQLDDVNSVLLATKEDGEDGRFLLCKDGIIYRVEAVPGPLDESIEYDLFIKRSNELITPDDISGTYIVRFLETSVFGQPFTCGKGTATVRANGTFSVDAYYSNGEHDVKDGTYIAGPGNKISFPGDEHIDEGIISPDKSLIFVPEYGVPAEPEWWNWIGGIFLVRTSCNIADLNADRWVNFFDYAAFAEQWLKAEPGLSANFNRDIKVDWLDLKIFAENWLWNADWYIP